MIKLEQYINSNLNEFLDLSDSEVIHMSLDNFDDDIIDYFLSNNSDWVICEYYL